MIRLVGRHHARAVLLAGAVVLVAGGGAASAPRADVPLMPELRALTPEEEDYAAALWDIHREVKLNAVTMVFAGIRYATGTHDGHELETKLQPVANFFSQAEFRVRALVAPKSLEQVQDEYLEAMTLYAAASGEMLKTARDGSEQRLIDAQQKSQRAAEDLLRVGEVIWPGEYKPN